MVGVPATVRRIYTRPTAEERATYDVIDAKMPEQERGRFARPLNYNVAIELRQLLDNIPFSPERIEMRRQIFKSLDATLREPTRPTADLIYFRMFAAIHGKPSPDQTTAFTAISPFEGERMNEWSTRFFEEYQLCKDWIVLSEEALSVRFMLGVGQIHPAVRDAVLAQYPDGIFTLAQARESTLTRWAAYDKMHRYSEMVDGAQARRAQGGGGAPETRNQGGGGAQETRNQGGGGGQDKGGGGGGGGAQQKDTSMEPRGPNGRFSKA